MNPGKDRLNLVTIGKIRVNLNGQLLVNRGEEWVIMCRWWLGICPVASIENDIAARCK